MLGGFLSPPQVQKVLGWVPWGTELMYSRSRFLFKHSLGEIHGNISLPQSDINLSGDNLPLIKNHQEIKKNNN